MGQRTAFVYDTPLGEVTVACTREAVVGLWFGHRSLPGAKEEQTPLSDRCYTQLCEYLKGERKAFDLPLRAAAAD